MALSPQQHITIDVVHEHELRPEMGKAILGLLRASFPGFFSDRIYYKQVPHWRVLAWHGQQLVGQVGVDHRVIRVGTEKRYIFGIVDLCVTPSMQGQGIGAMLLKSVEERGSDGGIQHIVLFADDPRLYQRQGFEKIETEVAYLAINEHQSLGVQCRDLSDCMMAKDLGDQAWPAGPVDLLGYLF